MYKRKMIARAKLLKKFIFFLVLLGFVLPMKAPVSSAQAIVLHEQGALHDGQSFGAQNFYNGAIKERKDDCLLRG